MSTHTHRTALVTGATSGLGLEAAAQLAENGFERVIITGRTLEKAESARTALVERTNTDVFEPVALDLGDLDTVEAAADALAGRGAIDVLLLNAGLAPTTEVARTSDGIELTMAASLTGHHVLTMRLLADGLLADTARIVIAGSEAARGDVPTFAPVDIGAFAAEHFDGDLQQAIESQLRMAPPATYKPADTYATAKVFVAWWAAELAGQLPAGMTVNAVSPGSTPDTNAARSAPAYMRYLMLPVFKLIPGMSHSVGDGARRYLDAAEYGPEVSGKFFASRPKKMTGPLAEVEADHLSDRAGQDALWTVVTKVTGSAATPVAA